MCCSPDVGRALLCGMALLGACNAPISATHAAANPIATTRTAVQSNRVSVREFAQAVQEHLSGPALRPFGSVLRIAIPPAGQSGVVVSTDATKNMSCTAGACTPTRAQAVLNVNQLARMLLDENVTVGTTAKAPDIAIDAPFSWTSSHELKLQAIGNIGVNRSVSDAGSGALTLIYNATGGGGALSFGKRGNIGFLGVANALTINGKSYILVNSIHFLAQLIARNPSGNFALAKSYDARPDGTYAQSPIATKFTGNFEGLGNTVRNLTLKTRTGLRSTGFFAKTGAAAYVGHFHVAGKMTVPAEGYIGGVIGDNAGHVVQAAFDGTITLVSGACYAAIVGGVVGYNEGTVSFSHGTGSMTGTNLCADEVYAGGLVGLSLGDIDHSWAGMSISLSVYEAKGFLGGLVGGFSGTASNVFATGSVTGSGFHSDWNFFGGLIGNGGSAIDASASGPVTTGDTDASAGGLTGSDKYVEDAVATGAVAGGDGCYCGGAVGDGGNEHDTVSYGTVTAGANGDVGGFIGDDENPGNLTNDGWDLTTSNIKDPSQGAGTVANDPGITGFN